MATSEAQKRASAKYNKANIKQRVVNFSPHELDLLEHLDAQPNKSGYIKQLIKADMEAKRG